MNSEQATLRDLVEKILDDSQPMWSVGPETDALHVLLQVQADFEVDPHQDIAAGETRLASGLAISPTQAAMCATEVARTTAFLRGVARAIEDVDAAVPDRPVRVFYAGCGPFALLAVPLMSWFDVDQVEFVLLDVHRQALDSARHLVDALQFSGYVVEYVCGDASQYDLRSQTQPDIIVSETMNVCLADEPLVTIACCLLSQCDTKTILIPANVRIEACLLDDSKEFVFEEESGEQPTLARDRILLGTVFELNASRARQWGLAPGDALPASQITIPTPLEERYLPKLLTTVTVYEDVVLKDYDTSLTIPNPIQCRLPICGGVTLEFKYRLGQNPELECQVVRNL